MAGLRDKLLPRMGNVELVHELALLSFVKGNEAGKDLLEAASTLKVMNELYERFKTYSDPHAALRAVTILKICDYVNKHPRASQSELKREMERMIGEFAMAVSKAQ